VRSRSCAGGWEGRRGETLAPWSLWGARRVAALSRLTLRGWTRESLGFSVPVQPVQPVQSIIEREKRRTVVPADFLQRGSSRSQKCRLRFRFARADRLARLDSTQWLKGNVLAREEGQRGEAAGLPTRRSILTPQFIKSGDARRSRRQQPHSSLRRQSLRA
jgi:hypothetical protein